MANNGGDCTAYLIEALTAGRTCITLWRSRLFATPPGVTERPQESPRKRFPTPFRGRLPAPNMTNALHEVLTRGQNRPGMGEAAPNTLPRALLWGGRCQITTFFQIFCGFNLSISLMLRIGYNLGCCVRGDSSVSLGFVDSLRTVLLES